MAKTIELGIKEVARNVTMTVTIKGVDVWMFRLKIAMLLIRLACWVAWMDVKFVKGNLDD